MRWRMIVLAGIVGCEELADSDDTSTVTVATTGWTTTDPETPWRASAHPCVGYRTDTLHVDVGGAMWAGCGSTTVGTGLYRSLDGGLSWEGIADPVLESTRVSSIQRSDGALYLGGIHIEGLGRVFRLDTDTLELETLFSSTGQLWSSFHVGTFRRAPSGFAVAESLTGTGLVYRTDDDAPWVDGSDLWPGTESYQILDLEVHDGGFYGSGSTIAQPPTVFVPDGETTDPFTLEPLTLASVDGELWAVDVDDGGVLAAGVDQDANVGVAFYSTTDPIDVSGWGRFDVDSMVSGTPTWLRGACRDGDHLVVVGERSMTDDGLLFESRDGGASWSEATPWGVGEVPALQQCDVLADGTVVVAGGDGFVARRLPS